MQHVFIEMCMCVRVCVCVHVNQTKKVFKHFYELQSHSSLPVEISSFGRFLKLQTPHQAINSHNYM